MPLTPPVTGALIQGATQMGGNVLSNISNIYQQNRAFSHNKEMWNLQNAYNSPAMQMQRYKEAGLNPNLIYGQGSSGNAQQAPTYQAPNQESITKGVNLPSAQEVVGMMQQMADIAKTKEETRSAQYQADLEKVLLQDHMAEQVENILGKQTSDARISKHQSSLLEQEFTQKGLLNPYILKNAEYQLEMQPLQKRQLQLQNRASAYNIDQILPQELLNKMTERDRMLIDNSMKSLDLSRLKELEGTGAGLNDSFTWRLAANANKKVREWFTDQQQKIRTQNQYQNNSNYETRKIKASRWTRTK